MVQGEHHIVLMYKEGNTVIGENSALTRKRALATYKAYDFVKAMAIPRRPFLDILEQYFPEAKPAIMSYSLSREQQLKKVL